jgi:serine/threonine protein kinase/predicted Zn-dependent protease
MDDRKILDVYPLPLARGYRRYLNAAQGRERHDAAYYLFEIYLKYVSSVAIAWYLRGEARDHRVNAALKGLARPSLGEWLRFLRECARFLTEPPSGAEASPGRGVDPALAAMAGLLGGRGAAPWAACLELHNGLRSFRTGEPSAQRALTLEGLLGEIVAYRNRVIGHGAPLGDEHYRKLAPLLAAGFVELLQHSGFLLTRPLVAFDSVQVEAGARVECGVVEHMGGQPVRREKPLVLPYGKPAPRKEALYLLGEEGDMLSIDPLLVARREDVYFLNEAEGTPEYISYSTGERWRPSGIEAAQGEILGRILGYRVDENRLSRIGGDIAPQPAAAEPTGGERRLGDFRIIRELGRGGMGAVFEAVQETLGRRVALKVLPGAFALEPRRLERFRREARATARIHHPGIVPVYEVGEASGTHYYAMEYVDGPTLEKLIEELRKTVRPGSGARRKSSSASDPAYIARAVEAMAGLCEGLAEAHAAGLVHRDVKPSNILVDSTGRYVLVDFGLVHEAEAQALTRSGEMVGTLSYMSPEQVSKGPVDARADVYGLGATLYEILTLRVPFEGDTDHHVHRKILFEDPASPRKLNPRVNRDLETIILKALEKNPERRYPSARAMGKDLEKLLRYEPIEARPLSPLTRLARRAVRHRGKVAAGAAFLLLALAVGWFAWGRSEEARLRRLAEYEPLVERAVLKLQRGQLARRAEAGENPLVAPGLEVLATRGGALAPYEDAARDLSEAVAADPGRPDAHYHRARALTFLGRDDEALPDTARVIELSPDFVPILILEAGIRDRRREFEKAEALRRLARERAESGWPALWLAAHEASRKGLWKEAEDAHSKLIDLEREGKEPYLGSSIATRLGRGQARLELKDYHGALKDFAVVGDRWPGAVEPPLFEGKAYLLMGEKARAEALFEKLHETAAEKDEIVTAVLQVYSSWSPAQDLEKAYDWAGKLEAGNMREGWRSLFAWWLGCPEQSIAHARKAIELDRNDPYAHMQLADVLMRFGGDREEIRSHFQKAIELKGEIPMFHALLAQHHYDQGEYRKAIEKCNDALARSQKIGWTYTLLGMIHGRLGNAEKSLEFHGKACEVEPLNPDTHNLKGIELRDMGKFEDALAAFDEASRVSPRFAWPHRNKAQVLQQLGRFKDAIEELRIACGLYPRSDWLFMDYGNALENEGRYAEAFAQHVTSLEVRPSYDEGHRRVSLLLRRDGACGGKDVDRLLAVLEKLAAAADASPRNLCTLALALLHHPERPDPARSLECADRAVEKSERKDPRWLSVLAEAETAASRRERAVEVLEEALANPRSTRDIRGQLAECRRDLLPRMPTFGSIDARIDAPELEVIIPEDASWRFFKGKSDPGAGWHQAEFDDRSWQEGQSGFGFGDAGDRTVLSDMAGGKYTTFYVRTKVLADPARYSRLLLSVKVDDGVVAYFDGEEVGRARAGERGKPLAHDAVADGNAQENPYIPQEIWIDCKPDGSEHCIALQGLNKAASSDFHLIPSLLAELRPDPARDRKLIEDLHGAPGETADPALLHYLEGKLLARAGKHREAAESFSRAAAARPAAPEPILRLAENLRAADDPGGAERELRRGLEGALASDERLWHLWAAVSFADLKRGAAGALESFPAGAHTDGSGEEIRWLLERLVRNEAIRINCGGEDHVDRKDRTWGRDRFARAGYRWGEGPATPPGPARSFEADIHGTDDDPLYQTERYFPPEQHLPHVYRIPLQPGTYQVTLHFAELVFRLRRERASFDIRAFDVLLEGSEVLRGHEPLRAGFATADRQGPFQVTVDDGILDIEFVHRFDSPRISAIEIEPAGP